MMATDKEKRVSNELKAQARDLGAYCGIYEAWDEDCTFDELIGKFIAGFDFCLEHDWPSPKYIRDNFPLHCLRANGIFCDDAWHKSDVRNAVVMGRSNVKLYYSDYAFGDVRVRHNSRVSVSVDSIAIVHIHLYDNASAFVEAEEGAKVTVFMHSKKAMVTKVGEVKVVKDGDKEAGNGVRKG